MTQVQWIALLCLTGAAAIVDARTQRIPNRLIAVGLLMAFVIRVGLAVATLESPSYRALAGAGVGAMGGFALGLVGCAILPLLLYSAGALGGGDVKLLAVVGALVALGPGLELTQTAFVVAGLLAFTRLAFTGRLWASLRAMPSRMKHVFGARGQTPLDSSSFTPLPFGPPVFIAACYLALSNWTAAPAAASSSGDHDQRGALLPQD